MNRDHVCIDDSTLTPEGWAIRGWWVASSGVACIVCERSDGRAVPLWHGHRRDDLAAEFPAHETAGTAGFLGLIPAASDDGPSGPIGARWWFRDHANQWRTLPAEFSARTPQIFFTDQLPPSSPPERVIEAGRLAADPEVRFRTALAGRRNLTLRLDIINKCNLRCVMCHYSEDDIFRRPARSVTPQEFETWFSPIAHHVREIMLSCADEPLMSRYFQDIVRLIRRIAPQVGIRFCTNATLMTAPIRRLIVEQQVDDILFSFDASTRPTLEAIRRGADFERILHNIFALRSEKDRAGSRLPALGVNFVMMRQNIHEAPGFVELAHHLGVETIDFRHLVECYDRFSLHEQQMRLEPGRFNHYRTAIIEAASRFGLSIYIPPPIDDAPAWQPGADEPSTSLAEFEETMARYAPDATSVPVAPVVRPTPGRDDWPRILDLYDDVFCTRPFTEVFIRDQKEVLPCPWHHATLGELSDGSSLMEIFTGEKFRRLRANMFRPEGDPKCSGCPLKSKELPPDRIG